MYLISLPTRSKDAKLNIEKWQHIFYAKCVNFVFDTMKHLLSRALCLYVILMCGKTANENNYKATKWLRWASMLYYILYAATLSFVLTLNSQFSSNYKRFVV